MSGNLAKKFDSIFIHSLIQSFHLRCDYLVNHLPPNHRHVPLGELAISRVEVRGYVFHELTHEDLMRRENQHMA
jgi:hypothetical protein